MSSDGSLFVRRALTFLARLRLSQPTTAEWLASAEEISIPTARRVIKRLQEEYDAPIEFDDVDRTWRLTRDWRFPAAQLADRTDILALTVALAQARSSADPDLDEALRRLRDRLAVAWSTDAVGLQRILDGFDCDRTELSRLSEAAALPVLDAIARERSVCFRYHSPWADPGASPETREVVPLRLRQLDGALYLLAWEGDHHRVFNLAFAEGVTPGARTSARPKLATDDPFLRTFGSWTGPGDTAVTVHISPPASRYFARQVWHADQSDTWAGDVLVRTMRAHPSPELVRRLLSLGDALRWVEPEAVRALVRRRANALAARLDGEAPR